MLCPSCNQVASTFARHVLSKQGVSFKDSLKGLLKCQHCGALLEIAGYTKIFYLFLVLTIVFLGGFLLASGYIIAYFGPTGITIAWLIVLLLVSYVYTFGMWRHVRFRLAEPPSPKP